VVLVKRELGGIESGSVETLDAKCPRGYSVFAGSYAVSDSAVAHASGAGVLSKSNAYETIVTNPPANINGGLPGRPRAPWSELCAPRTASRS
jgi:hypothetical protein